jgi:hypothetical protein
MITAAAFALFCLVCAVRAFTRHPVWGVYFYIATTYVFPPGRWWGYIFQDFRWALFAAGLTSLAIILHRGKLQPKPLWLHGAALCLFLYALWMWMQTPFALDVDDHVRGASEFTKCLVALWFVYRVADSKERVSNLVFAHVLGCGLLGIYAWTTGRSGDRLDGVGGPNMDDANALAMYLATGTLCAIGLALSRGGWRRYVSLAASVFIVNGFVLANTRGAFLGLAVAMPVFTFCIARRHRRLYWALTLVGVAGLTVLVDKAFIDRMFTIGDVTSQSEAADPSARSRLVVAEAQLKMFLDHPMGVGYRGTAALSAKYMDERWLTTGDDGSLARSSHNTFLTALTEQGFIGAVIYVSLLAWTAAAILRSRRLSLSDHDPELATLMAALVGSIVVVLVSGTSADNLTKEVQFWLYGLLLSGFWLASREEAPRPPFAAPAAPGPMPVAAPRTR